MRQCRISFAGAGRVTDALCRELHKAGSKIDLIVSQKEKNGTILADSCKAKWSSELVFPLTTDILIVAVPDHILKSVLGKINCSEETLVVHTAGSFGIDVFPESINRKGVFYPLQTFSKNRKVDFKNLPFLIESSDKYSSEQLKDLAESIGGNVHFVDTDHRRMLHLAAVFTCNFTNFMLTAGKELSLKAGFSFDILHPLIKETISKAIESGPENSQTGPAIRKDQNTIEKHLELLSFSPELQMLYKELTLSITKYYNKS
jgi:predicted short-subunit dehydrogenase-like oxidoreductase (DUF2520 family)